MNDNITDLNVGVWYRAKKPKVITVGFSSEPNDRQIIWMGNGFVQYDGPSVKNGKKFPKITVDKFMKWAASELTPQQMKLEGLMD